MAYAQSTDAQDVLYPGFLARALRDIFVQDYVKMPDGTVVTMPHMIPVGDVFTILSALEIVEISTWEVKLLYNSQTYFVNFPLNCGIIGIEEVGYDFPFEHINRDSTVDTLRR